MYERFLPACTAQWSGDILDSVRRYVRGHLTFYLEELQAFLQHEPPCLPNTSLSTICRALHFDLGLTWKIFTKAARESVLEEVKRHDGMNSSAPNLVLTLVLFMILGCKLQSKAVGTALVAKAARPSTSRPRTAGIGIVAMGGPQTRSVSSSCRIRAECAALFLPQSTTEDSWRGRRR